MPIILFNLLAENPLRLKTAPGHIHDTHIISNIKNLLPIYVVLSVHCAIMAQVANFTTGSHFLGLQTTGMQHIEWKKKKRRKLTLLVSQRTKTVAKWLVRSVF